MRLSRGFKARVRGIYSTSITKLLLDEGLEIVQPSPTIRDRFKLSETMQSPDVDIYDKRTRQGVHVEGTSESLEIIRKLFSQRLTDAVFRIQSFPTNGIYKGLVEEEAMERRLVRVNIGSTSGILADDAPPPEGRETIVQVTREGGSEEPILTREISIPGDYAVLITEEKIKVSRKIRALQKRHSLIELGKRIAPLGLGIIWRTTAADQPAEVLEDEIDRLVNAREKVLQKAADTTAPTLLWGNRYHMKIEFPALSKTYLDGVRTKVAPTIKGHHLYKACGRSVSAALEMAERMLESSASKEEVEHLFKQTIEAIYPAEGCFIRIEHLKPNGRVLILGHAKIDRLEGQDIRFSRVFQTAGVYDDLGSVKEPGDRAVTDARVGDWTYVTRYYSKDGVYKGAHINVNTPLELYPRWIRYVDLEVDICVSPEGSARIVDEHELEKMVAGCYITDELASLAKEHALKTLKNLKDILIAEKGPAFE